MIAFHVQRVSGSDVRSGLLLPAFAEGREEGFPAFLGLVFEGVGVEIHEMGDCAGFWMILMRVAGGVEGDRRAWADFPGAGYPLRFRSSSRTISDMGLASSSRCWRVAPPDLRARAAI